MKKHLSCLIAATLLLMPLLAFAEEIPDESEETFASAAKAAILIEAKTGTVLYGKNADQALPMASTTKVMTALLALEYGKLDEPVTCGKNAFGVPGTSIYLDLGEQLSLRNMLYGLMLASGNDAATAIAEHIGGTVDGFCQMMTDRAKALGCKDTVFKTPHGLPNNEHHTTAHDLALIAREAMTHEQFRNIVKLTTAKIPWQGRNYDRVLKNKNRLLTDYQGATGIKTGYTKAAGRCLVFSAERNGMEVIGVVLNCGDWFNEAMRIMDSGFESYYYVSLIHKGETLRDVTVTDGDRNNIAAIAKDDLDAALPKNVEPAIEIDLPASVSGDIEVGQVLGKARLMAGQTLVKEVPLVAKEAVHQRTFRFNFQHLFLRWFPRSSVNMAK